jgi:Flp pilus assembly protein protease CpaA
MCQIEIFSLQMVGAVALLALSYIDCRRRIVPNRALLLLLALRTLLYAAQALGGDELVASGIFDDFVGALCLGGTFFAVATFCQNSIGFGDVKLLFILPLYFGAQTTTNGVLAGLLLFYIMSYVFIKAGKWTPQTSVPLVPFIAVGVFLVM